MKNFVRNISNKFNTSAIIGGMDCFSGNWAVEIKGADKNEDRKGVGRS